MSLVQKKMINQCIRPIIKKKAAQTNLEQIYI